MAGLLLDQFKFQPRVTEGTLVSYYQYTFIRTHVVPWYISTQRSSPPDNEALGRATFTVRKPTNPPPPTYIHTGAYVHRTTYLDHNP